MMFSLIEVLSVRGDLYPKLRANPNEAEKVQGGEKKKKTPAKADMFSWAVLHRYSHSMDALGSQTVTSRESFASQERAQAGQ